MTGSNATNGICADQMRARSRTGQIAMSKKQKGKHRSKNTARRAGASAETVGPPDTADMSKVRSVVCFTGIVWLIAALITTVFFGLLVIPCALLVGIVICLAFYAYVMKQNKKMIAHYKKAGLTEKQFVNMLKSKKLNGKQIDLLTDTWRRTDIM